MTVDKMMLIPVPTLVARYINMTLSPDWMKMTTPFFTKRIDL